MNLSFLGLKDGLQPPPEGLAHHADVVSRHGLPHLINGGLQGGYIGMVASTGLALNVPPDKEVQ